LSTSLHESLDATSRGLRLRRSMILMRVTFLVGIVLIVAGGVLLGQIHSPNDEETGLKLVKAGYIVVVAFVVMLFVLLALLWTEAKVLNAVAKKVRSKDLS
jgi:uncharacterized BrkB/YihY/UPF0761 family membrane protein